jgi:ribonuclease HII
MRSAVDALAPEAELVLVDGNVPIPDFPRAQRTVVGGDARSVSIAAASIVAKVTRDALMRDLDGVWYGYGFASHVGYGTRAHLEALRRLGPSPAHRRTFRGVADAGQPNLLERA